MNFFTFKYSLYLKYIRYRIYYIKNITDMIKIIKNINYFHYNLTSDKLSQILIDCFNIYPLDEKELQKISIIQQEHDKDLGIKNYVSFILWLSCIQSIIENNNNNKLLK